MNTFLSLTNTVLTILLINRMRKNSVLIDKKIRNALKEHDRNGECGYNGSFYNTLT